MPQAGPLVIVADDEAGVRRYASEVLARAGYRVVEAADGATALAAVTGTAGVAAAVLDCLMPGLTGPEVVARLRAAGHAVPVVLVSGTEGPKVGAEAGGVRFLPKPFTPAALVGAVCRAAGADVRV